MCAAHVRQVQFLLTLEPDTVNDIAEDCGFGNASHLSHYFRAHYGYSPHNYARGPRV